MRKKITTLITLMIVTVLGIIIILNKKNKPYEITGTNNGQFAFFYEDDNGEYQRSDESKWSTGEYILNFENSSCDGEKDPSFLSWNNDNNSVILMRNKATKCNLYFDRKSYNFAYTGDVQEFIAPVTGDYKIELWGAQGGDITKYYGGKGAYTTGIINLTKGTKLYVYVGNTSNKIGVPSFNGGAETNNQFSFGTAGGGATDVRLSGGDWKDFDSLKSRIMVAAGGGGATDRNRNINPDTEESYYYGAGNGGYGGALIGGTGQAVDTENPKNGLSYGYVISQGGTQTSGGIVTGMGEKYENKNCKPYYGHFGYAGNEQTGGGGGYFGGGGAFHAGAGGGSSYISGYQGCVAISDTSTEEDVIPKDNCTEETALNNISCSYHYSGKIFQNANMIAGDSIMPSPTGGNETGHSGNGLAKITLVDIPKVYDFSLKEDVQEFIAPINGNYKIELWGASGGDKDEYSGGKGGYTAGIINLKANDKLYVYVGGAGSNTDKGGYNGGADLNVGQFHYGSSGGGATDVRLESGNWNDFNSLKSRIMVAAGGGGANNRNISANATDYWYGAGNGGYGGGLIGGAGESNNHSNPNTDKTWGWSITNGATQTNGGFHTWHKADTSDSNPDFYGKFGYSLPAQSTGGGGYYGGASGWHSGAGGGSSFISGYQGCVAIEETSSEENIISKCTEENAQNNISCSYHYSGKIFTNTIMKAGNEVMPSPSGGMETGHLGNGYARITLVSSADENITLTKAIDLSGNDYDGEFIGNTIIKKDGNDGYGIYFDGNKSYVDLGTLPSTIDWEKGFTIEFEAKWLEHRNWSRIFDIGNGHHNDDLVFYLSNTVGRYGFDIFKGSTMIENNLTTGLSLNVKTKIKIIYKSSEKQVELYKDDTLVQTVSVSDTINNIDRKHCYLGKSNVEYDPYFNGYIYSFKLSDSAGKPIIWYNFN